MFRLRLSSLRVGGGRVAGAYSLRWNTASRCRRCRQRRSPGCTLHSQMHVPHRRMSSSCATKRPTPSGCGTGRPPQSISKCGGGATGRYAGGFAMKSVRFRGGSTGAPPSPATESAKKVRIKQRGRTGEPRQQRVAASSPERTGAGMSDEVQRHSTGGRPSRNKACEHRYKGMAPPPARLQGMYPIRQGRYQFGATYKYGKVTRLPGCF